jgi:PAS domain S-box-containing protein
VILSGAGTPGKCGRQLLLFEELRAGSDSYTLERPYRHKDGSLIWGRTTVSLVRDDTKKPSFAIAMVEDITERKQMESEVAGFAAPPDGRA